MCAYVNFFVTNGVFLLLLFTDGTILLFKNNCFLTSPEGFGRQADFSNV